MIRDKNIAHDGDDNVREHLQNSAAHFTANEDSKLRIVKKTRQQKIDAAIALSMAVSECLRLSLT